MNKMRKFADDPDGWRGRLEVAAERSRRALSTSLARDPRVENMGMQMGLDLKYDPDHGIRVIGMTHKDIPELDDLTAPITWARPFLLKKEAVYWENIVDALRKLSDGSAAAIEVEQVGQIWSKHPFKRVSYLKSTESGENILPEGGVDGGLVANRLLYSEIVHTDDSSEILDHIDNGAQMWNLAGMVADWLATLSYQERVIHMVAPEVIPKMTEWAGNQKTIFDRMGVEVVMRGADEADRPTDGGV